MPCGGGGTASNRTGSYVSDRIGVSGEGKETNGIGHAWGSLRMPKSTAAMLTSTMAATGKYITFGGKAETRGLKDCDREWGGGADRAGHCLGDHAATQGVIERAWEAERGRGRLEPGGGEGEVRGADGEEGRQ